MSEDPAGDRPVLRGARVTLRPAVADRHVALDIALAPALHGQGYGSETLRLAIRHWIEARGHHRFSIDPSAANEQAIRAYAAIGFKPVGILRRYERAPDGSWRDSLLMDLLADELVG